MTVSSFPKGLFFSQPTLGVGQLTRSLYICKSLVNFFDIDFVLGAPDINQIILSPHFHLYEMPPLWLKEWDNVPKLVDPFGKKTVEEVFEQRSIYLEPFLETRYDFIIIELYPFSKWKFKNEIERIIQRAKQINPACLIICSMRDIAGKKLPYEEQQIVDKAKQSFDSIFIHSDPSVIAFDETFAMASALADKIVYTGYVADPESPPPTQRGKQIVVSIGGGTYGLELPRAVSLVAAPLKEYDFLFIMGPKTPPNLRQDLELIKRSLNLTNIQISEFSNHFYSLLNESCLSISLGGSTLVDLVKTHTPSLVYPLAHVEHVLRANKFASHGVLKILSVQDLHPERLCQVILEQINTPFPMVNINTEGSLNTALELKKRL